MQSDPGSGVPHTGDDDEVWRDLVARLEEPDDAFLDAGLQHPDGPVAPDAAVDRKGVDDFDPLGVWRQQATPAPHEPAAQLPPGAAGPRDYAVEDDGDGEFVPEELPSLRNSDPAIMMSWIGAAGGPLFLVFASIFWRQAPLLLVIGVIMAFIAGTGYLLYRLPNSRDHDGGDGAVV
ncbi:hypothetical protein JOF48_003797 [Arthrobacter stackebrandtii]|uniref:DUF308 domain-containing protein n=1 Tax=Arthrobacter stackebrandtii TaxID=272161 RepID=A0ABS4Z1S3_9MICC|nr:hypothetical protein [Arthrobacter stackebrandtii]MBP2414998.1 hypothetical protein [Arthrobacter stackebrandtii]PYH00848.1 hypothetical protein CVV67_07775 [Arthrobacter stackebrandtii]